MMRVLAGVVAALTLGAAAVAQEAPKTTPTAAPAKNAQGLAVDGSDGKWFFAEINGGAIAWENNSIERDAAKGTARMTRLGYFVKEQASGSPAPYNWLFQTVLFDCKNKTIKLEEGAFLNKGRLVVGALRPWDESKQISSKVDVTLYQVACQGMKLEGAKEAVGVTHLMDAIEAMNKL